MRYIKSFNEELKSATYRSAASKLKKIGGFTNTKRAEDLSNWARETSWVETVKSWKQNVETLSKFGTYKLDIKTPNGTTFNGDFHLIVNFMEDTIEIDFTNRDKASLHFSIGVVPTSRGLLDKLVENDEDIKECFGGGFLWTFWLNIDIKLVGDFIEIDNIELEENEDDSTEFRFTSSSAQRFKSLLIKIFSDRDFNYPSSNTRFNYEYENINTFLCIENGLSVDYGFKIENIAEYIKTVSKHKFII